MNKTLALLLATMTAEVSPFATKALAAEAPAVETRNGLPCWVIRNDQVEVSLTQLGGHMAPVTFFRDGNSPVKPYYISPWQEETHDYPVPVLVPLRGDFFCLPFGDNAEPYLGKKFPPHGETAGSEWDLAEVERSGAVTTLAVTMNTTVRQGTVTKKLHLRDGENVIYSTHTVEGFEGRSSFGHHATLAMPDEEGVFKISHSPIRFGMVNPNPFSVAANGEYQQLEPGDRFSKLTKVESIFRDADDVDVSRQPQKKGYADLLAIFSKDNLKHPAWLAAVNSREHWLWFSFKDPAVLPATVFWLENHGRHGSPWLGRNNCVGLEDVCALFVEGVAGSARENVLTKRGIKTAHEFTSDEPFNVHYIQGVAKVPAGFEEVKTVEFGDGAATFVSTDGERVTVSVDYDFLKDGTF